MHTNMLKRLKFFITNLLLIFPIVFITSCAPSLNSLDAYRNCSTSYENMVKVQDCARNKMSSFQRDGGTVYTSDPALLEYWDGLAYKVKTNQISNSEAKTRLHNWHVQKNRQAAETARQIGEMSDGFNCILFQVNC